MICMSDVIRWKESPVIDCHYIWYQILCIFTYFIQIEMFWICCNWIFRQEFLKMSKSSIAQGLLTLWNCTCQLSNFHSDSCLRKMQHTSTLSLKRNVPWNQGLPLQPRVKFKWPQDGRIDATKCISFASRSIKNCNFPWCVYFETQCRWTKCKNIAHACGQLLIIWRE